MNGDEPSLDVQTGEGQHKVDVRSCRSRVEASAQRVVLELSSVGSSDTNFDVGHLVPAVGSNEQDHSGDLGMIRLNKV